MTNEVFDQDNTKPKYEVYDVNSLYPEPVDVDELVDWREKRYGIKHPGVDAPDEEIDAYYDELERLQEKEDEAWRNRPAIEKFFFAISIPIAAVFILCYAIQDAVDAVKDKYYDWKDKHNG